MKLFGIFGKDKAVPFLEFRDIVRKVVRKAEPSAQIEPTEKGFHLRLEGKPVVSCNLQNLYNAYVKDPSTRDALVQNWLDTLIVEVPEHSWYEATDTLRPTLKTSGFIEKANYQLGRSDHPEKLPSEPFVGELHAIVMREVGATLTAVTDKQLERWGQSYEAVLKQAILNMGMLQFPVCVNEMNAGASAGRKGVPGQAVGLVFEQDFMTATWLLSERFRDHLFTRLSRDYIVAVPNRSKLVAVRADEPGLIAAILSTNRNLSKQAYPLTDQCYHVSASAAGGVVTVFKGGLANALDPNSVFAKKDEVLPPVTTLGKFERPKPVDLSQWGGLTESSDE